jgi:hypothetical protein
MTTAILLFLSKKNPGFLRMNVIGMVCPRTGQFFAIKASDADSATFQAFLEEKLLERLDQAILDVINNPKKNKKNYLYRNIIMTNALMFSELR